MASGLLGFLGFGKRAKTNLTPQAETSKFEDLPFTRSLSDLASSRLKGEGLGFGSDFTDRAANPGIAKLESQFQQKTLPGITSAASARGLGRSSLVTSQIGQAEQNKNQDVADLVSKFYTLNKAQEKNDMTEAIGLGQNLNNQAQSVSTQRANEARDLRDKQLGVDTANNAQADKMQGLTLQALGGAVTGFAGAPAIGGAGGVSSLQGALKSLGMGNVGKQALLGNDEKSALLKLLAGS